MAVKNAFQLQNASGVAADVDIAARNAGSLLRKVVTSFEVEAADDNGSIYRVAKLPVTAIVHSLRVGCDAIAGFTDPQVGVYKPLELGGAVIDVDCLMAATDLHNGQAIAEALATVLADRGKDILSLAGVTDANKVKYGTVDVAVTTAAGVSAAGTVVVEIEYSEGV
jgi:hypothetical protein